MVTSGLKKLVVKNCFSPSVDEGIAFNEPTLAKQSFKEECDINFLIGRYRKTGDISHLTNNGRTAQYGDFSGVVDYHTACNQVFAAQEAFMELPAALRARFENDPGQFIEFVDNPANRDELIKLGLMKAGEASEVSSSEKKIDPTPSASEKGRDG